MDIDSWPQKIGCKINSSCTLDFGQTVGLRGSARFVRGRLAEVILYSGSRSEDPQVSLEKKYGPPATTTIPHSLTDPFIEIWRSRSGESIRYQDGLVDYKSAEATRAAEAEEERARIQY